MKKRYLPALISAFILSTLMFITACKKDLADDPARLFRPVAANALTSGGNWISGSWQPIKSAKSYTLQVSRDTFKTLDVNLIIDSSAFYIPNLKYSQLYQVQVKANALDTVYNSQFSFLGAIKTAKFPSILLAPSVSDITEDAVKVSWLNSGATVTSVKILKFSDSSVIKDVPLTGADVTNQFKIVSGLPSSTAYIIMLYSGTTLRGYENFSTKSQLTGTIIDLRGITGRPSVLTDTLPLIAAGSTILLKRGETYNIATSVALSQAVTIQSGSDLSVTDPAILYFTSNFNFAASSIIDYIDFKDVILRGSDYASKYIFNTTASATVTRMRFENCRAEFFRGMVRLQSGVVSMTNFIVNNCILDSLAGYGVITMDNVTCVVDNISIKNSTIYKAEKIITSKSNSVSVIMENCTVNEAPFLTGNYIIDYTAALNVTSGIKVYTSIFGSGKQSGTVGVRGIRAGATTNIDAANNYNTSDYLIAATTPFAIPNIVTYAKKSTDIWVNPLAGNFKIIDGNFPGKSITGDPRWYY